MINKEQLKAKYYPRECWINVYETGQASPLNQIAADIESYNMKKMFKKKTLYRIHVRLK